MASPSSLVPLRPSILQSSEFRPSLPLDPFIGVEPLRIGRHVIQVWAAGETSSQVILIIGEPSNDDILPLISSSTLASSLIMIVAHKHLSISPPTEPCPSVYILQTIVPLSQMSSSALSLVSVLERASIIACEWRQTARLFSTYKVLTERTPGGDFMLERTQTTKHTRSRLKSRQSIASFISYKSSKSTKTAKPSRLDPGQRAFDAILHFVPSLPEKDVLKLTILITTLSSSFLSTTAIPLLHGPYRSSSRPSSTCGSLPSGISSLISSDSLPNSIVEYPTIPVSPRNRWSALKSSSKSTVTHSAPGALQSRSRDSMTAPYAPTKAHIIHVLPSSYSPPLSKLLSSSSRRTLPPLEAKSKLVRNLEHFLFSFAYNNGNSTSIAASNSLQSLRQTPSNSRPASGSFSSSTRCVLGNHMPPGPLPYLLASGVLGYIPKQQGVYSNESQQSRDDNFTIGELLLLGVLDHDERRIGSGLTTLESLALSSAPRVWIGKGDHVSIVEDESCVVDGTCEKAHGIESSYATTHVQLPTPPASDTSVSSNNSDDAKVMSLATAPEVKYNKDSDVKWKFWKRR